MKVYIATSLDNVAQHHRVRDWLKARGHTITVDWTVLPSLRNPEHVSDLADRAHLDLEDGVREADLVIVLLPGGAGTHVELGAALALRKHVWIFGRHSGPYHCVFHYHGAAMLFPDEDPLDVLALTIPDDPSEEPQAS